MDFDLDAPLQEPGDDVGVGDLADSGQLQVDPGLGYNYLTLSPSSMNEYLLMGSYLIYTYFCLMIALVSSRLAVRYHRICRASLAIPILST